jgi:predicted lipid-binding transport protein (Tim44 family)
MKSLITCLSLTLVHSLTVSLILLVRVFIIDMQRQFFAQSFSFFSGSIFEESDQAQAIRAFQTIDPTFNMDKFMVDARKYIVPELMEAYLKGDVETLKVWCSEAVSLLSSEKKK